MWNERKKKKENHPKTEQKKQGSFRWRSQENNMKREKSLMTFSVLLWSVARTQAHNCVWIGKKGIASLKKILSSFILAVSWLKGSQERIRSCKAAKETRQGRAVSAWHVLRQHFQRWDRVALCPLPDRLSSKWNHLCLFSS